MSQNEMKPRATWAIVLVVAIMVLFGCGQTKVVSGILLEKVHVYLTNELASGNDLTVHCKSKDNDLGVHQIVYNGTYEWTFRNNIWDTTLFWCDLQWGQPMVTGSCHAYEADRDQRRCRKRCMWKIKEMGLYSFNMNTNIWENLCNWNRA
ncbi:self-incompatibility protein S1-like [Impatiens glandulifera]|uniref:self-incompatibility protein S1-like n=1 Tax=Impatiens glandulifera TaxID=253017 RepID=UPI001FB15F75|nr:self-incompatibility protein S1-like [Impatiens glandulifera]